MRKKNKRIRDLNNSKKSIYQQKGKGQGKEDAENQQLY